MGIFATDTCCRDVSQYRENMKRVGSQTRSGELHDWVGREGCARASVIVACGGILSPSLLEASGHLVPLVVFTSSWSCCCSTGVASPSLLSRRSASSGACLPPGSSKRTSPSQGSQRLTWSCPCPALRQGLLRLKPPSSIPDCLGIFSGSP